MTTPSAADPEPVAAPARARDWVVGAAVGAAVALVSLSPFLKGLLLGRSLYFRDLAGIFIPLRQLAAEDLRHGVLRYWSPFSHEGAPVPYPPVSYPFDVLQALLPGPFGITLVLLLHVPLAALGTLWLARQLGLSRLAAAAAGLVFALGGFCLSSINLYVYIQAAAWTPVVVLCLVRASRGERRAAPVAAIATAILASTLAVEFLVQAVLIGLLLGWRRDGLRRLAAPLASVALGLCLAAPSLFTMQGLLAASGRGAGFAPQVTLAHSVHPFTLLQALVANLYGDMANPVDAWWGGNFFPAGYPYFVSLYLGATVLAVAWVGLRHGAWARWPLLLLLAGGVCVSLGRWAGLEPLVRALPLLGAVRYPSKVFLSVQLAVALLAGLGLGALAAGGARAWRTLASAGLGLGLLLVAAPRALVTLLPVQAHWFVSAFFPPALDWPLRLRHLGQMIDDSALGGSVCLLAAGIAWLAARAQLRNELALGLLVVLAAGDLLRAGAGLNPMARASFFDLSPQMAEVAAAVRDGGRAYVCRPETTRGYWEARRQREAGHEAWSFAVMLETFTPYLNVLSRVPTAYSQDLTSLVPRPAVPEEDTGCRDFARLAPRLRAAAVTHVISLDALDSPELRLEREVRHAGIAPATIHVFRLADPLPRFSVATRVLPVRDAAAARAAEAEPGFAAAGGVAVEGDVRAVENAAGRVVQVAEPADRLEVTLSVDRPSALLVRDTWAPGWSARLEGRPAPLLRANGLHRAVMVPAGTSRVRLEYHPPGLALGLWVALAGLVALALWALLGGRAAASPDCQKGRARIAI